MKGSHSVGIAIVTATALSGISAIADRGARELGRSQEAGSATPSRAACDQWLPPLREVKGSTRQFKVGPSSCQMMESTITVDGRPAKRVDIGLDGTVDGYVSTNPNGDYRGYMTNAPDLVFPQTADPGPIVLAIATYLRAHGAAMSVVWPAASGAWNGKMWVTAHGASGGVDVSWDEFDPALNPYDELMVSKGYALVKTRRTANASGFTRNPNQPPTGIKAVLEDGTPIDYAGFNDTARYIMDFALVAESLIEQRLGRTPSRTYFYGHSAGARLGRGINYVAGLNQGADGQPMFDGIFVDDSAAGTWLPVVMKDGSDVQFATDADKAAMVPQLEVVHQMYNNIWTPNVALGVTHSYLENKRRNAKIMHDKGLTQKFRVYEVRSISHAGSGPGLDVTPMWDGFIDILDAWVDRGVTPPPSRSDWVELGDANRDGAIENPALSFPEVACPLGVHYPTTSTSGNIAFAAFTGHGLEPLDERRVFVDMNRNGVWDFRETSREAWQRLRLLEQDEALTRERYVACVEAAARALHRDGFFSKETVADYVAGAKTADLQPKDVPPAGSTGAAAGAR